MNRENLLKAADYIETIPQEKFSMDVWRDASETTPECGSVGCIVGHCTVLDSSKKFPRHTDQSIDFIKWSESFFRILFYDEAWTWLFAGEWQERDNTPSGSAARIRDFVKNGLPDNWVEQMNGKAPLSYKP